MANEPNAKIRRWADLISEAEMQAYAKAKFGESIGLGEKVALLNIDTTNNFVDPAYDMCAERDDGLGCQFRADHRGVPAPWPAHLLQPP